MASHSGWTRPEALTQTARARLDQIAEVARHHARISAASAVMGMSVHALRNTVHRLTGSASWPPVLEPWLFALPVEAQDDEAETLETVRAKFRHWLRATNTQIGHAANGFNCNVSDLQALLDGGDVPQWLAGRVLARAVA